MLRNTERTLNYLVSDNIRSIQNRLEQIQGRAQDILSLIHTRTLPDEEPEADPAIAAFLHDMLKRNPEIESVYLAYDKDLVPQNPGARGYYINLGKFTILDLNRLGIDFRNRDWFQIPQLTKKEHWSEPWFDADGKKLMITSYSLPIYGDNVDEVIGIIRLDIALSALQRKVISSNRQHQGSAILISHSGRILVHEDESKLLNETIFSLAEEDNDILLRQIGKDMLAGKHDFVKLSETGGSSQWICYAPLVLNNWSLGIIFNEKDIFRDLNTLLLILTLFLIGGFLAIAIIISYMAWRINSPLRQLAAATYSIGQGDFEVDVPLSTSFNEIRYLSNAIVNMRDSLRLYMADLLSTTAAKNRIESELRIASLVQKNLIPQNNDQTRLFPGLRVFGILEPAKDIGGDLFDYFRLDESRFCFVIADVLGNGLVAAMTMIVVNTLIRTKARTAGSLKQLLLDVNNYLCETQSESNFVTAIIGMIDLRTGLMEYSNAGHVPMYLRKVGRHLVKYGETQSTALGIFPDIEVETRTLQLDLGDTVILFTDGITEAMSKAEAFFGEQRLELLIQDLHNPEPETIVKSILNSVRDFTDQNKQTDDTTILVIEYLHPMVRI